MPEPAPTEPPRWREEEFLPVGAREALAAERSFALRSRTRGMKAAFLEWLVEGATVFGPDPTRVEDRFGSLPDAREEQPALEWLPEWIMISGSQELAAISGRWNLRPVGEEYPTVFGQYLSVWQRGPDGWRVLADIGTDQPESRPLTPQATGRMIVARAPRVTMVPDPQVLAAQVEGEFETLAFRDGYARSLENSADGEVIVLRAGVEAKMGVEALQVDEYLAALGPRIELSGSAASSSHDMLATWGVMHFDAVEGPPVRLAFLRVWQLETVRWQIIADVILPMP